MNKISFDMSAFEEVEIIPIGDCHIGSPMCDEQEIKRIVDYIAEEPENPERGRICLLNGDITDSVTTHSKGNVFDMTLSPQAQIAIAVKYFLPLMETSKKYPQGKIISYCSGNHDYGRYNDTGITAAETIAVKLGLEDRFSNDGCYSFINLKRLQHSAGNRTVTVYNQHMSGSAGTIGGKANRVGKISNGIFADLIIGSHVHSPLTFKEDYILPNCQKHKLQQRTITYVITNAFMRFGDYAQRAGMKPSTIAVPKIIVKQDREQYKGNSQRFFYIEVIL